MTKPSGHISISQAEFSETSLPTPEMVPEAQGPAQVTYDDDGSWGGLTLNKCQHSKTMFLMVQFPALSALHS